VNSEDGFIFAGLFAPRQGLEWKNDSALMAVAVEENQKK